MEGQTLRNIVEYDMSATVILEEYAADKKKRDCLTAFAECQEIVTWIQRETNGTGNQAYMHTIILHCKYCYHLNYHALSIFRH